MTTIDIGLTATGAPVALPLRLANRHGLVTGATGTGKSVTLQRMAEQFSAAGVPVFAADVKGDLSGIATGFPVAFWDIFGRHGLPVRTSVQDMGAGLLARMLGLNPAQEGAMEIVFRKAEDERAYMLTLDDLRWSLNDMMEEREEVCKKYGNVTASSIAAIQRNLLALEAQGGDNLFGEPPFDIMDLMRQESGMGVVNLLHADQLMEAPKLYATFLLWLLTELFRKLPEAGDLAKPKLVFFFDEAHLLFRDAPKPLIEKIERLVRLVRSKGVGVFFVTQSVSDVPDAVSSQLGSRIQHAVRAYSPRDQRVVAVAAKTFRANANLDVKQEIMALKLGEALISLLDESGAPCPVEKAKVILPSAQIGPVSDIERQVVIEGSPLFKKYRSGATDTDAAYAFSRRMLESRGIDPGPEIAPAAYEPGLYLKYLPAEQQDEERAPGALRRLASISAWALFALGGARLAGLL